MTFNYLHLLRSRTGQKKPAAEAVDWSHTGTGERKYYLRG